MEATTYSNIAMIVRQFDIMLDEMYHQIGQSFYMSHFAEWHGLRSAQLINDKRKMIEIIDWNQKLGKKIEM